MSAAPNRRGRFFVLDGIDGCGKSTQARLLVSVLARAGEAPPLHLREPGSTTAGERVRALLLDPASDLSPEVETLLFAAARRQMLDELVRPALADGRHVVCERFHAATFAYQAVAGGLDEDAVLELLERWAADPAPDLELLLDLDLDTAVERTAQRGAVDRIEAKGIAFQRRVAEGFRQYAERVPRVVVIDANGTPDEVARRVRAEVQRADH